MKNYYYKKHVRDAILKDESFKIGTAAADFAVKTASALAMWITEHKDSATIFEQKLVVKLQECVDKARVASGKMHSDRIWTAYHTLHTSDVYVCDWQSKGFRKQINTS